MEEIIGIYILIVILLNVVFYYSIVVSTLRQHCDRTKARRSLNGFYYFYALSQYVSCCKSIGKRPIGIYLIVGNFLVAILVLIGVSLVGASIN